MCRSVPSFEKPLENDSILSFTHPFRWLCPFCNHIHFLALFLKRVTNLAIFSIWRWQWCNFLCNYQWFFFKTYKWLFFKTYQWFFFKNLPMMVHWLVPLSWTISGPPESPPHASLAWLWYNLDQNYYENDEVWMVLLLKRSYSCW